MNFELLIFPCRIYRICIFCATFKVIMYFGECPKIKDGCRFHGSEAWEKIIKLFFSPYFSY